MIAIREDEIAAEASGINTTYYKLLAFVVAAFFAGVAGGIYAHYIGVLDPSKFDFNYSVEILIMVVLGGMGSITAPFAPQLCSRSCRKCSALLQINAC